MCQERECFKIKRYCKDFVMTPKFIEDCIYKFMNNSNSMRWNRTDVAYLFAAFYFKKNKATYREMKYVKRLMKTNREKITRLFPLISNSFYQEIINRNIKLEPIIYQERFDRTSNKLRKIGISSIKQQIYDYIAVGACKEMFDAKIGQFQCASIEGRGCVYGLNALEKWIKKNPSKCKWIFKCDIKKYYPNINHEVLIDFLKRDIKNDTLIYVLVTLIKSYGLIGLCIGSYLSQYLANYLMSYAYHFVYEFCYRFRKNRKTGKLTRVNLINKAIFYMDDITMTGSNRKDVLKAADMLEKYLNDVLRLDLKSNKRIFNLNDNFIDMMGFKIYKDHTTIRKKNFKNYRKLWIKYKDPNIEMSISDARTIFSNFGNVKHTDSYKLVKKYKIDRTLKRAKKVVSDYDKRVHRKTARLQVHAVT